MRETLPNLGTTLVFYSPKKLLSRHGQKVILGQNSYRETVLFCKIHSFLPKFLQLGIFIAFLLAHA